MVQQRGHRPRGGPRVARPSRQRPDSLDSSEWDDVEDEGDARYPHNFYFA